VGKSNLIEAITLLQAAPTGIESQILRGGGVRQWLWLGDRDGERALHDAGSGSSPLVENLSATSPSPRRKHPAAWNILLRDSEGPLLAGRLASEGDSIFWMVEAMESWFHADKDALEGYYKTGFRKMALKPNPNVEAISKRDLFEGLNAATKDTLKGKYHKTKHAPALMQAINPALVRKADPNCERLFNAVLDKLG
jgi:hypothetical protein